MLRIGCLGAAKITPMAVLAPARKRPDVAVTAVAARDPARAYAYAAAHGIAAVADSYADLVRRDDVDLVYNGLPPSAHAEWTIAALQAGKHVLCEKPFAMDMAEAEAMAAAATASGRLLIEGYHYRHHALTAKILAIVASGRLGKITRARATFCVPIRRTDDELRWRADLGGGAMMDLGCYPLHMLRTVFGAEPEVLKATARVVGGVDARMLAQLRFGDTPAQLYCAMRPGPPAPRLRLDGTKQSLRVFNFVGPQFGHRLWIGKGFFDFGKSVRGPGTYDAQLAHVVAAVAREVEPVPSLADSLAQMRAISAIYAAAGLPRG